MDINHKQWTVGGTMITNFSMEQYPIYRKSIRKYHKLIRGRRLKIVKEAFYGDYAQIKLNGHYSLHSVKYGDLSPFWRIYDKIKSLTPQ